MNLTFLAFIIVLALIDVVLALLLIKLYRLFSNMQTTIIMQKELSERNNEISKTSNNLNSSFFIMDSKGEARIIAEEGTVIYDNLPVGIYNKENRFSVYDNISTSHIAIDSVIKSNEDILVNDPHDKYFSQFDNKE